MTSNNEYDLSGQEYQKGPESTPLTQENNPSPIKSDTSESPLLGVCSGVCSPQDLSISPFHPLLNELSSLSQDKADHASHSFEIIRLYSTLLECHAAKVAYTLQLEEENELLRASNGHLGQRIELMDQRIANQEALLVCYGKVFERFHAETGSMLYQWNSSAANPAVAGLGSHGGTMSSQ
ncbi:hypothetical protein N7468_009832 [Penicillium chermesinum]|uniref:Uncharacterized protein n=1 Tax=Penicillium chermesinum TaxID=63820 RepID=A0A9W9NBL6_9EURO|nr:uncharacterized protein N7468_009832 [Penicillium chermesinum]KAJ5216824.1 hypothetical protein N7468_009832 [Penicillium chermesinum]